MPKRILLLSDIFGRCEGLAQLVQDLTAAGAAVQLIAPYQGQQQSFANEAEAYAAYIQQCGHDAYAAKAEQALQNNVQPLDLAIGFSAGASALWRALAPVSLGLVKQAVLFYPGQIHQQLALNPKVPVQIIFGHSEPHFAVTDICTQLQQKPGVTAVSTSYAHGFMNPASKAFDEAGYQQQLNKLLRLLG